MIFKILSCLLSERGGGNPGLALGDFPASVIGCVL